MWTLGWWAVKKREDLVSHNVLYWYFSQLEDFKEVKDEVEQMANSVV